MAEGFVVSDTVTLSSLVTVHGLVVDQVSPLKTSKSNSGMQYFNGSFTDERRGYVWFQLIPRTDELEILFNTKSSLIRSPKKFKITEDEAEGLKLLPCPVVGTLKEIKDVAEHQQLTIIGKILSTST